MIIEQHVSFSVNMEFDSNRGGKKFAHDGFIYNFDKALSDGRTLAWRCERRDMCCARIHTVDGNVMKAFGEHHAHDSDPARILIQQKRLQMKQLARNTDEAPSRVINESFSDVPDLVYGMLPSQEALKKTIRYVRAGNSREPPAPENLCDLVIPHSYQVFKPTPETEEQFLLLDSGPSPDRILVFGRERNILELKNSETWFVDGTFSITPKPFYQVFVILAEKYGAVHPFFYVLLPGKTELIYTRMFIMIKSLNDEIAPVTVHCDFEIAIHNSVVTTFPGARIYGCFFHLMSNMRKHVGALGLTRQYRNEIDFAIQVRFRQCYLCRCCRPELS